MKYMTAECSMKGGRSYNEDSVRWAKQDSMLTVAVADGLGGHGGGEIASSLAAESITNLFTANPEISTSNIQQIFEAANLKVLAAHTPTCQMKSTAVALFIKNNIALWAHVGDSRLYHFINGRLVFQTSDHSVSQMAVLSGEIKPSQIRFHEDRNKVLRVLGNAESIKTEISPAQKLEVGFHAFLLCTDGFWEYVLEEEMEIDLSKANTPNEWLSFMIQRLSKRVHGKNDNFTAAAVFALNSKVEEVYYE